MEIQQSVKKGRAIALESNIDKSSGGNKDPGDINSTGGYVKDGELQWDKFASDKEMSVERKDEPFTIDMYNEQGIDSSTSYWTGIKVPYNSDKKEHWVGVNGFLIDKNGKGFFIISPTSVNDSHVGAGSARGGVGWKKHGNDILVPASSITGYVVFSKQKVEN